MKIKALVPVIALIACSQDGGKLTRLGELPVEEISGIEYTGNGIWALEDSGNKNRLYRLENNGALAAEVTITNIKNNDWEDITSDVEGNIYIGDFGNNDNDRKNLAIYKVNKAALGGTSAEASSVITFSYPEQKEFPPKKSGRVFDVEAFFEHQGDFYLFTKNRSSGFNGDLNVYKVPNRPGNHSAKMIGTLNTCGMYKKCAVTAADITSDGKTAVLLAGDRLWLLTGFSADSFDKANMQEYQLGHYSQKEGICFKGDSTLLIADERDKKEGGFLYSINLATLKSKP
jgi:hypothetical protein